MFTIIQLRVSLSANEMCEFRLSTTTGHSPYAGLTLWRIYGEWAYECNSPPIRNDCKVIARHS